MRYRIWNLIAALAIFVTGLFVLTGSYLFINKPRIPAELAARKDVK